MISILLFVFLGWGARAETGLEIKSYSLTCGVNSAATRIWTDTDNVYFRFTDMSGFQNFPLYEGVLTMPMVPYIDRWTKELAVFNGMLMVSWPRSQCQFDRGRPALVLCHAAPKALLEPADTLFQANGISTQLEANETIELKYSRLKFNLGLDMNSPTRGYFHYFITFPLPFENCAAHIE